MPEGAALKNFVMHVFKMLVIALSFQIVEDLLELMYRCTFVMPMKSMSTALQVDEELSFNTMESESMFGTDIEHEGCIKYWPGGNTDKGMLVELDSAKPRYILSKIPLVSGKYNWKVQKTGSLLASPLLRLL